jgi:hypothetical protein
MQRTTVKGVFLALILASALPLAACSDDNNSPTAPTQPGPPVAEVPTPPPPPPPTPDPAPTPTPPVDDRPEVSVSGPVVNLERSGEGGLDITFRIDDFTIVRAPGSTPVIIGSETEQTDAILTGMTVTAFGKRTNGFLDATRIVVDAK